MINDSKLVPERKVVEKYIPVSEAIPLLRGVLTKIHGNRGKPVDGHPELEKVEFRIEVYCPYCDYTHIHAWDPDNGSDVASHRINRWCDHPDLVRNGYYISPYPDHPDHVATPGEAILRLKGQVAK